MKSSDFSKFEFCPRLVNISKTKEPVSLPVRDALKRFFSKGVEESLLDLPQTAVEGFLEEAGRRGFIYPQTYDVYTLAQDFACWLDGALKIVDELMLKGLRPCPPLKIGSEKIQLDGYLEAGVLHIFRVGTDVEGDKWDTLIGSLYSPQEIQIHTFLLPGVRGNRLLSPLVIAYRHPTMNLYRLSKLDGERGAFSAAWRRVGRWEDPSFSWPEWRAGIDKDQCLDRIYKQTSITQFENPEEIKTDMQVMMSFFDSDWPRKRETCTSCMYLKLCHGDKYERASYLTLDPDETVQDLRIRESDCVLSQASE